MTAASSSSAFGTPGHAQYAVSAPSLLHPGRPALSKSTVLSVLLLSAVLMLSGVGIIFYTLVTRPVQLRAQATATVQAALTSDTHSAATADAYVTSTAQAQALASATAQTQATAQAQATATTYANLYRRSTSGPPALDSSLATQSPAIWDVFNAQGNSGCAFSGGALRASISLKHTYIPCFARATNFTNFVYEVQMTIVQGDDGGLIFRTNSTNGKFYFFSVGHDGIYSFVVSKDSTHSTPLAYDRSSLINTKLGQSNILTVIAQNSNFFLYINKQFVASTTDNTYTSGEIGVFADDMDTTTVVAFRNARVWRL